MCYQSSFSGISSTIEQLAGLQEVSSNFAILNIPPSHSEQQHLWSRQLLMRSKHWTEHHHVRVQVVLGSI